jgi:hypothetical protein
MHELFDAPHGEATRRRGYAPMVGYALEYAQLVLTVIEELQYIYASTFLTFLSSSVSEFDSRLPVGPASLKDICPRGK